ncbi:MAG: hypothetical protein ABI759_20360 [Candidatus Solibacter sp.]
MSTQDLLSVVQSLTPREQEAVSKFIDYLRERNAIQPDLSFLQAADEFIVEHPEILRRLSQ